MKTKFLFAGMMTALLMLFTPSCTKNGELSREEAKLTFEETLQIPETITQHLTEADWEEILYSQPPELPEVRSRSGSWHFWIAWGDDMYAIWYPITGDCDPAQIPDNICWQPSDCPGITTSMDRMADSNVKLNFNADRNPRMLGSIDHTWNNFSCGNFGPPVNAAINISLQQNGGADRAQFYWTDDPSEVSSSFPPGQFTFTVKFYPCTDANPHPKCWMSSTGQFADIQGSITYKWWANTANLSPPGTVFVEEGPASLITWGWLYY